MTAVIAGICVVALVAFILGWALHRAAYPYSSSDLEHARKDSVARSHQVVSGKVREHLVPLLPEFASQFDGRDARFLGSPVDYVVFDGLDAGDVDRIVFVEVKTGRSALSTRERRVRDAVEAGRVEWQVLRLPDSSGLAGVPER